MAGKGMKKTILKFVIPEQCSSEVDASDSMKMAFQECREADLAPQWISESDVTKIRHTKNTVVVLQEFSGATFEKLRTTKCVICGPMCLRNCLTGGLQIPENKSPVFTTAMRDIIVTASQVPATTKTALKERVGFMGGIYVNNLTESVTHLLTDSVQSAKYELAGQTGIPAMCTEWVEAVWKLSQEKNIHATEPELMRKYRCPVFFNVFVTTSNLSKSEKEEVKRIITENGGTFTTQMKQNETMLLIVNEARGEKYKHARLWNVPCVKTEYLKESVRAGYALPTNKYLLEPIMRCSTPTKEDEMANFTCNSEAGMISVINFDSSKTNIDDTQATFCTTTSTQPRPNRPPGSQHAPIVENMTVIEAKKAGTFMDGCKVFLSGFSPSEGEKLRRILSLGGATVFSELSESVSHVLVGDFIVNDMKALNQMAQKPHIVTVDWITASMKQRLPVPEEPFYCMSTPRAVVEPPSPLSQKNLQLLSNDSASAKMPPPAEPTVPRKLFSDFVKENAQSPAKTPQLAVPLSQENLSTSQLSMMEESTVVNIFDGLNLLIAGFNEESSNLMATTIETLGGCVVASDFTGVADYAVVPSQASILNITAVEVVTSLWLEECVDMKKVMSIQYYHQPFPVAEDKQPLEGCCISLSNYTGMEKAFLTELVQMLGATYQDVFARVAKPEKNVAVSTHLICPVEEGQKYKAAVKWNLPVVTKDWLLTCAKQGIRVSETLFLVNSALTTKTPEQNSNQFVTPAISSTSGANATPAVSATPAADLNQTPVTSRVNPPLEHCLTSGASASSASPAVTPSAARNPLKRLSSARTPDSDLSPFHVKTPDTPYGQVFGTPTNSSKKRWKKFIDEFPTNNVPVQPSPKRRRDSTPLSELKRRVFQMAIGQLEASGQGAALEASGQTNNNEEGNYSIEDMDENIPTAECQDMEENIPTAECQMGDNLTPVRCTKPSRTQSSSKRNCENIIPKRLSGRETPSASDFKRPSEVKEAEASTNSTPNSSKKTTNSTKPCNEAVSALLGNLQKRLSLTPGNSMVESQLPQRQMVSPSDQPVAASKPGSSTLLPESQPVLIGWEDPVESAEKAKALGSPVESPEPAQQPKIRKFVLSNVAERDKYEKLLDELGEVVVTSQAYDSTTTHLIMDKPVRSEKLLCCLAAGKWILHTSYVDQMAKQRGCDVPEEDYEWGSELSASRLPVLSGTLEQQLAAAAVRWRRELQAKPGQGAFSDIQALLVANPSKYESYQRLILAGGGSIVPPGLFKQASHCFVEANKVSSLQVPLAELVAHRVPCLPPVYLGDMIIKYPRPPVEDSLISEYRNALTRTGQ